MIRRLLPLTAAVLLSACSESVLEVEPTLQRMPGGLTVDLVVDPVEVGQHEPFTARVTMTNATADTIRIVTAHGCLVLPHVIRDGRRVPFEGSWWGCTAAITTHVFLPGETRVRTWDMRAALYAEHPGDVEGRPAPRGTYRVQAQFDTYLEGGPAEKPAVEATLRVQ